MSIDGKLFKPIIEFISTNKLDFNGSTMIDSYLLAMTLSTLPDLNSEDVEKISRNHAKILDLKLKAFHMLPMAKKYSLEVFVENTMIFYDYFTSVLIVDLGDETNKPLFHALRKIRYSRKGEEE